MQTAATGESRRLPVASGSSASGSEAAFPAICTKRLFLTIRGQFLWQRQITALAGSRSTVANAVFSSGPRSAGARERGRFNCGWTGKGGDTVSAPYVSKVSTPPTPGASIDRPAGQSNVRLCRPPELPACGVQVAIPAQRAEVRWIVGATLGQRRFVVNFDRQGHPTALHAKPAQRFALQNGLPQPLPRPAGLSFARVHHAQIAFNQLAGLWPPDKRQNRQNPTKAPALR